MARKTAKKKSGNVLVRAKLTESARTVWLAGVGALAMAEHRGGQLVTDSEKLFGRLVKEGKAYETKNRKRLSGMLESVSDARSGAGKAVGKVTGPLSDKVTAPLNDAVATALHKLGVPTRKEIATLTRRVEELTHAVERSQARRAKPEPEPAFAE